MPVQFVFGQIELEGQALSTSGVQRKIANVFCYVLTQFNVFVPPPALFASFQTAVWNGVLGQLNGGPSGYNGVQAYMDFPFDNAIPRFALGNPGNATGGGAREPLSTAIYVNVHTGKRGRYYTGSKRFGPIGSFQVAGDELLPVAQAAWQATLANMNQPLVFNPGPLQTVFTPCVWSRQLAPPQVGLPAVGITPIVSVHVNATLSTWRHRREKVVR